MKVKKTDRSDTEVTLTVVVSEPEMTPAKEATVKRLGGQVKLPGFRPGKAPLGLIEKNLDQTTLQSEFLNDIVNQLYVAALEEYSLRPVDRPQVNIKKFIPFTELEFDAEIEVVGHIELVDYKKIKKAKTKAKITSKDVEDVIRALRKRLAKKEEVSRAAKEGDEVWIDFSGKDTKGELIKGADGKDYPLILGSDTFIPGFEKNLIGAKMGADKTFTLTFPKEYGLKTLAGKKVTFDVKVKKVQQVNEPKVDDEFATHAGPFRSLEELKADISKQLQLERQREVDQAYENELVREITAKSKVATPKALIEEQIERLMTDTRQNLTYRGQTFQEFLEAQATTEEEYRMNVLTPQAEERVKAGLILAEIAESERLSVSNEEIEKRLQQTKAQYQDEKMQEELNKPEARESIASRILTEKTVLKLVGYSSK